MLLDWFIYGLLTWGLAALLNATIFKQTPASKATAWTLAVIIFVVNFAMLSAIKAIRYQVISDSIGVPIKANNPLDLSGAFLFSWLFFSLIRKGPKNVANPQADSVEEAAITKFTTTKQSPQIATSTIISGNEMPVPQQSVQRGSSAEQHQQMRTMDFNVDEDRIYTDIAQELETGVADKGLWTRLFAECGGDEKQTKVAYIKQRAQRLIDAERSRQDEMTRQKMDEAAKRKAAKYAATVTSVKDEFSTGEELDAFDKNGLTPLMIAILSRDEYRVQALLELGAKTDKSGRVDGKLVSTLELAKAAGGDIHQVVKARQAQYAQRVHDAAPKGTCPNPSCNAIIPLASPGCPKCGAVFEKGAAWSVRPRM